MNYGYGVNEQQKFKLIASYCYGKTLDVGCARKPNKFIPSPVTGLDVRPLREWRKLPRNYVKRVVCGIEESRFENEFDCVVASELIEHLVNPLTLFDASFKALKKRGLLVVCTDNPYRFQTVVGNVLRPSGLSNNSSFKARELGHINFFVPRMLNLLAVESGFKVKQVTCGGGYNLPFLQQKFIYVYEKTRRRK